MTRHILTLLSLLFASTAAIAAPVITSISHTALDVKGGVTVTIRGTGFATCPICSPPLPPAVYFGATPARSANLVDSTTLIAVAPPHLPATVSILVDQFDGRVTSAQTITYSGDYTQAFETILLPVYAPPVHGAFGAEFHTTVVGANKSEARDVYLYGTDSICYLFSPSLRPSIDPTIFRTTGDPVELLMNCSPVPARFFYVPKDQADLLTMNIRVADVTRTDQNHGTEIPVVRSSRIRNERIVLLGVPVDARYRSTLRIYSNRRTQIPVTVTIEGRSETVLLQPGENIFEPSYASYSNFPTRNTGLVGQDTIRVTIDPPPAPAPIAVFPYEGAPIWAFITVTNNDTQQITTITPD